MKLKGKTVLLTGASKGLGSELATQLGARGCRLLLVARDETRLESVRQSLNSPGSRVLTCDLTDADARMSLVDRVRQTEDRLDLLIHCAGVGSHSRLSQMTVDEVARVMQVNAQAPLELTVDLRPQLTVNIGSVAGELRLPSIGLYAASKAALHAFTQSVALEGTRTLLVILGPLRGTDFVQSIAHPQTGQPGWYRRLDVPVETASRLIVRAMKRDKRRLVLPRWYHVIFFLARLFSPVIKTLSYSGGHHAKV